MISNTEKIQVRQLLQTPQWDVIERIMKQIIQQILEESTMRNSQWETIKAACLQQGRIEGINRLHQELYSLAQYEQK